METDKITEKICNLPEHFKQRSMSSTALIQQSGYLDNPETLSHETVLSYLQRHPFLIDLWLMWSGDKRSAGGWYFKKDGTRFVLDLLEGQHEKPRDGQKMIFKDAAEACTEFIIKEIKAISGL